jgi:hypothetical protein
MTPEDLSVLVDRLLDDALSPQERDNLAARIAHDADLHQRLASELALALQIRAVLAQDAEQRADLLMATLSGSRRLALAERLDRAIDATAGRAFPRWLPWTSVAAAAVLMLLIGGWWSQRTPARSPARDVASTAPAPQRTTPVAVNPPSTPVIATPETPRALPAVDPTPIPDALVAQTAAQTGGEPAPPDAATPDAAPEPAPLAAISSTPDVRESAPLNATQANSVLAKPDLRALRSVPPVLIKGSPLVRRQGREAASVDGFRLVPGDEVRVSGDGADLNDDRGITWWCSPDTRLSLPPARPVEVMRQPVHVTLGTVHVTAAMGLRPLITTPHLRIDADEADVWLTVTTQGTRVETISGSVHIDITTASVQRPGSTKPRPGIKTVRPLAPGFYALTHPGQGLEIHPTGQNRLSVIGGRFARDGDLQIPRILQGTTATIAADLGATALLAPLADGTWLDQASYRHLNALIELPPTAPATRILKHPALSAWVTTNDARAASAMRRADPLRPIHLAGPAPAKLPTWATTSELPSDGDAPAGRATLAVIPVDAQVHAHTWDALIRGAQGLIWTVVDQHDPAPALQSLTAALDATQSLLTDGSRAPIALGDGIRAARWDRPGRRLVVVVNRNDAERTLPIPHTSGLAPVGADESLAVSTTGDLTTATLPPHGVLILQGSVP